MKLSKNIAISDNGFIFNPLSGDSFSTNPIGQEIIQLLKAEKSQEDIVKQIASKYNIDQTSIERDLDDFVQMLQSYQLLMSHE